MRSPIRSVALAISIVAAAATFAEAKDICLNLGGFIYALKGTAIPGRGKCKSVAGIAYGVCGGHETIAGSWCRASDDSHVDVNLSTLCRNVIFGSVTHDHVTIPYPSLVGGTDTFTGPTGLIATYGASVVTCSPTTPPVNAKSKVEASQGQ